jgi:hypothetical protein
VFSTVYIIIKSVIQATQSLSVSDNSEILSLGFQKVLINSVPVQQDIRQVLCCSRKKQDLYSGGAQFESWAGHFKQEFHGFPQPFHANATIIRYLVHDHFKSLSINPVTNLKPMSSHKKNVRVLLARKLKG